MTTPQGPQGPQGNDPNMWARPAEQGPRPPQPPPGQGSPEGSTQRIPRPGSPMDQPTQHIPRPNPTEGATQRIPTAGYGSQPPTIGPPPAIPGDVTEKPKPAKRPVWRDPVSIVLIVVIVLALAAAGLAGGEWYARSRAATVVGEAIKCVTKDDASNVSFAIMPPFLYQHMTGEYKNIRITTAGGNIREAKGMKADISISDVRLDGGKYGAGTIGPLEATITWPNTGIKETAQQAPLLGSMVTDVTTNPSDGTIKLGGPLGSVIAKPEVNNHDLKVNLVNISALGMQFPPELVQSFLSGITDRLAANYPLNVRPDSVQVTDSGVVANFSSPGADIPQDNQDPCFASL
jgi:hypothetical protein